MFACGAVFPDETEYEEECLSESLKQMELEKNYS